MARSPRSGTSSPDRNTFDPPANPSKSSFLSASLRASRSSVMFRFSIIRCQRLVSILFIYRVLAHYASLTFDSRSRHVHGQRPNPSNGDSLHRAKGRDPVHVVKRLVGIPPCSTHVRVEKRRQLVVGELGPALRVVGVHKVCHRNRTIPTSFEKILYSFLIEKSLYNLFRSKTVFVVHDSNRNFAIVFGPATECLCEDRDLLLKSQSKTCHTGANLPLDFSSSQRIHFNRFIIGSRVGQEGFGSIAKRANGVLIEFDLELVVRRCRGGGGRRQQTTTMSKQQW